MAALHDSSWLAHPLAPDLVRFNLLPSRLFHPSRIGEWLPRPLQGLETLAALHRCVSATLLRNWGVGLVRGLEHPAMPLCLASAELWASLVLHCGLAVLAPSVRRVITHQEVASLQAQLGAGGLRFARAFQSAPVAPGRQALQADIRAQALALGAALLACALDAAPDDIRRRGQLRLPVDADMGRPDLGDLAEPRQALAVARRVLNELEPEWLSSFPDPR